MGDKTRAEQRLDQRIGELADEGDKEGIQAELERWKLSRCGARTKTRGGRPCRARALANGRCVVHGVYRRDRGRLRAGFGRS